MKTYIKVYFKGLVHGLGILTIILVGFLMVRADFTGLKVDDGTTAVLTANKWNELIASLGGVKLKIITGIYKDSDGTYPHGLGDSKKILGINCSAFGATGVVDKNLILGYSSRLIRYDSTNIFIESGSWPITPSENNLKCVVMYKD